MIHFVWQVAIEHQKYQPMNTIPLLVDVYIKIPNTTRRSNRLAVSNAWPISSANTRLPVKNAVAVIKQLVALSLSNHALEITQFGTKHSLNVAVSAGIALFHISSQFHFKS